VFSFSIKTGWNYTANSCGRKDFLGGKGRRKGIQNIVLKSKNEKPETVLKNRGHTYTPLILIVFI